MVVNIQGFISEVNSRRGLAKDYRYEAEISMPQGIFTGGVYSFDGIGTARTLTVFCHQAEYPGRGLATNSLRINGPDYKIPYNTIFPDVTLSFYCSSDMIEKRFFDDWMEMIHPMSSPLNLDTQEAPTFDLNFYDQYVSELKITQFDDTGRATYAVQMIESYPVQISSIPLSYGNQNVISINVTFAYRYWRSVPASGSIIPSYHTDLKRSPWTGEDLKRSPWTGEDLKRSPWTGEGH